MPTFTIIRKQLPLFTSQETTLNRGPLKAGYNSMTHILSCGAIPHDFNKSLMFSHPTIVSRIALQFLLGDITEQM